MVAKIALFILLFALPCSAATWTETLQSTFPSAGIIETFDNVTDWTGAFGGINSAPVFKIDNAATFPSGSNIKGYSSQTSVGQSVDTSHQWIGTRGATNTWYSKNLAISYVNFVGNYDLDHKMGTGEADFYFGDGTANSGFNPIYVFFMLRFRKDLINIRTTGYAWAASAHNGEYYLTTAAGGNPGLRMPKTLIINGTYTNGEIASQFGAAVNTTYTNYHDANIGSLASGHWTYGDNDSLGYNTIYVKIGSDPDIQADGYIQYLNGFWTQRDGTPTFFQDIVSKFVDINSGFSSEKLWESGDAYSACSSGTGYDSCGCQVGRITQDYGGAMSIFDINPHDESLGPSCHGLEIVPTLERAALDTESTPNCYWIDDTNALTWFSTYGGCGANIESIYDEWIGIEIKSTLSSTNNAADGAYEYWIYDSSGTVIAHQQLTGVVTKQVAQAAKFNKVRFGGNRFAGAYAYAEATSWNNVWYLDDFIANGDRVGPTYFTAKATFDGGGGASSGTALSGGASVPSGASLH